MPVTGAALAEVVEENGMIRILGLDCPLDVFRRPNEFEEADFDGVCQRARFRADGTLLPHPIDLILNKIDTGRDKDRIDIFHLESLIRAEYRARLPQATAAEARDMLERCSDWEVLTDPVKDEVGWSEFARLILPRIERDNYSKTPAASITAPKMKKLIQKNS